MADVLAVGKDPPHDPDLLSLRQGYEDDQDEEYESDQDSRRRCLVLSVLISILIVILIPISFPPLLSSSSFSYKTRVERKELPTF